LPRLSRYFMCLSFHLFHLHPQVFVVLLHSPLHFSWPAFFRTFNPPHLFLTPSLDYYYPFHFIPILSIIFLSFKTSFQPRSPSSGSLSMPHNAVIHSKH
jgi:hypothetical protein